MNRLTYSSGSFRKASGRRCRLPPCCRHTTHLPFNQTIPATLTCCYQNGYGDVATVNIYVAHRQHPIYLTKRRNESILQFTSGAMRREAVSLLWRGHDRRRRCLSLRAGHRRERSCHAHAHQNDQRLPLSVIACAEGCTWKTGIHDCRTPCRHDDARIRFPRFSCRYRDSLTLYHRFMCRLAREPPLPAGLPRSLH